MDNDRTVGRTNVRKGLSSSAPPRAAGRPSAPPGGGPPPPPPPPIPPPSSPGQTPGGTSLRWPTVADRYELVDRIGQGAFATVWRARIAAGGGGGEGKIQRRKSGVDDDERGDCAIKIMDLEHVNINIS
ncbi:hypothetical protein ACHAWF_000267, partial [Thalassiosira exigua]